MELHDDLPPLVAPVIYQKQAFPDKGHTIPGWDSNKEMVAVAKSLSFMKRGINEIVCDAAALFDSQNSPVERYEIDELWNTITTNNCSPQLQANMRHAQGDLCGQLDLLQQAGHLPERDSKSFDRILGSFMPHNVHWNTLMGFNCLEFVSDSTLVFEMGGPKKDKHYPWESMVAAEFPDRAMLKNYDVRVGATLQTIAGSLEMRKIHWDRRMAGNPLGNPAIVVFWSANDFFSKRMKLLPLADADIDRFIKEAHRISDILHSLPGTAIVVGPGRR